jgi:hypothetical protein
MKIPSLNEKKNHEEKSTLNSLTKSTTRVVKKSLKQNPTGEDNNSELKEKKNPTRIVKKKHGVEQEKKKSISKGKETELEKKIFDGDDNDKMKEGNNDEQIDFERDENESKTDQQKTKKRKRDSKTNEDFDDTTDFEIMSSETFLVTENDGKLITKIKIEKFEFKKKIYEMLNKAKSPKVKSKKEVKSKDVQKSKKRKQSQEESEESEEIESASEERLKLFQEMTTRELDASLKSSIIMKNKKTLAEVTNPIEERVKSFENILSILGIENISYEIFNLKQEHNVFPDSVKNVKDLENLDSDEYNLIEKLLSQKIVHTELKLCLILYLKVNQMKKEKKNKKEIINAKTKTASALSLKTNTNLQSLIGLGDKLMQIGYLISVLSESKREEKLIKEDEFMLPKLNQTQSLKLISIFKECYHYPPLLLILSNLFSNEKEK